LNLQFSFFQIVGGEVFSFSSIKMTFLLINESVRIYRTCG